MKDHRPVVISTDASFRDGHAGIAGVLDGRDHRILFFDVVQVDKSSDGERLALEKAILIARKAGWRRVVFRIDCEGLKPRSKMRIGWRVDVIPRGLNAAAHACCREALRVWETGRAGKPSMGAREREETAAGRAARM